MVKRKCVKPLRHFCLKSLPLLVAGHVRQVLSLISLQGVQSELRLGFVDLNFECSTVCPILLGLMGIWQKRLGSWARWWNTEIKVNPTQVYEYSVIDVYLERG